MLFEWLNPDMESTLLDSALPQTAFSFGSASSRASLSLTQGFPWQRSAWLKAFPDSAQPDSKLSLTTLSLTQGFPWQRSAWLKAFPESAEPDSRLSLRALSLTQGFPWERSAWFYSLSLTALILTKVFPWERSAWLKAFPDSAQPDSMLSQTVLYSISLNWFWKFRSK